MSTTHRTARELSTLLEVSQRMTSTLELGPLLGQILDQLRSVIPYTGATVLRLQGEHLIVFAYRGPASEEEMMRVRFDVDIARAHKEVLLSSEPRVIPDVRGRTALARAFRESVGEYMYTAFAYVRSWMGVPLIAKEHVIGMLGLYHSVPDSFSPRQAELANAFANQAAVAIENAQLYSDVKQRADEMQTLYSVQRAITSRLDLQAVLQLIADEAARLTSSRRSAVLLKEGEELRVSSLSGTHRPGVEVGFRLGVEQSVVGSCIKAGRPLVVGKAEHETAEADYLRQLGISSFLAVPMLLGEDSIGVISVSDRQTGEFNADNERVLTMLASGATVALENARLYKEERERRLQAERGRRVAEGLREILATINASRPLEEVLETIVVQAADLLHADLVGIQYRMDENSPPVVHAAPALPGGRLGQANWLFAPIGPAGGQGGAIVLSCDENVIDESSPALCSAWGQDCHTVIAVPLTIQGKVRGGLEACYRKERDISSEELRLAEAVGDQAALAIENSMLRAQAEHSAIMSERNRIARDLHDAVTQTLFSASLIADVLPRLWPKNSEEGLRRLEELRHLTRGALAEMRTMLLELRPNALTEVSLGDLLRQLVEAIAGRSRLPIAIEIDDEPALPPDVQVAMYRIAQEALNNVVKHSGATSASVSLRSTKGKGVEIVVADDGRGFDGVEASGDHLGLRIMNERASAVGAELAVHSAEGRGTVVKVKWGRTGGSR